MADIILNGINPITGEYLAAPMDAHAAARAAIGANQPHPAVAAIQEGKTEGITFGLDPTRIEQAGWALIFHAAEDPAVRAAFDPLVKHRLWQIEDPGRVKTLAYNGEEFEDWLGKQGVAPGTVKPTKLPLYLLVVGDPERIPFEFTQLLDLEYAVGRLHLDSPADYARYVKAVIDYETTDEITNAREVVFFGTEHTGDAATNLSCEQMVKPLLNGADGDPAIADSMRFRSSGLLGPDATKSGLSKVLNRPSGEKPPAFLFSATHGIGWPADNPLQSSGQGALLCGDWKGRGLSPVPITADMYFAAADAVGGNVRNLIAFVFACYGLGTPLRDKYSFDPPQQPKQLAPKPFFSALPKAMLSAPEGPALAVIGHIERAWASSIAPPGAGSQIQPFQNALAKILSGVPLGLALTDFTDRYGAFAGMLNTMLTARLNGTSFDEQKLGVTWTQQNDAQSYMLFGDPAIKLRFDKTS